MIKKTIVILLCIFCVSSCQKKSSDSQEMYNRLMRNATSGADIVWKGQYLEEGKFSDYILVYGGENRYTRLTVINHTTAGSVEKEYTKDLQVVDSGKNWTTLAPIGVKNIEEYKTTSGLRFYLISTSTSELRSLDNQFIVVMERLK